MTISAKSLVVGYCVETFSILFAVMSGAIPIPGFLYGQVLRVAPEWGESIYRATHLLGIAASSGYHELWHTLHRRLDTCPDPLQLFVLTCITQGAFWAVCVFAVLSCRQKSLAEPSRRANRG